MRRMTLVVVLLSAACAGGKPVPQARDTLQPLPETGRPDAPSADLVVHRRSKTPLAVQSTEPGSPLRIDEARAIVADLEKRQAAASPDDPLRNPRGVDDILEILRRDQIDLFGAGVALAKRLSDPQATALQGQIELAWGEALLIVGELLDDVGVRMREAARPLQQRQAAGGLDQAGADRLSYLKEKERSAERLSGALGLVGMQHLWAGASLAQSVMEEHPDSYMGYRLAADFHRLRGDWGVFDELMSKIEKLNPESNGLVFLKGVAALNRDGDVEAARAKFRQSLERDGKFVRAQVYLYLASPLIADAFDELLRLRQMNANHQLVVWALPAVADAFDQGVITRKTPGRAAPSAVPATPSAPGASN